jgi:hypothetical protein
MLSLENNNWVSKIIAYGKRGNDTGYYFSDKEYWIVEWWDSYGEIKDVSQISLEEQYYNFIQRFRIDIDELKKAYKLLEEKGLIYDIMHNIPCVYVDFDNELFISTYYEQALEDKMIGNWQGKYEPFLHLIPEEYHYWVIDGIDYSKESNE